MICNRISMFRSTSNMIDSLNITINAIIRCIVYILKEFALELENH